MTPYLAGCGWLGRLRRLFFGSKSIVSDSDPSRRHDTWLRIYTIISRLSLLAYTAAVKSTTLNQSQVDGANLSHKSFRVLISLIETAIVSETWHVNENLHNHFTWKPQPGILGIYVLNKWQGISKSKFDLGRQVVYEYCKGIFLLIILK